jgi:hypothetical protein
MAKHLSWVPALVVLCSVLVVAQLVARAATTSPVPPLRPEVGRYQLFQGYFTALDGKNNRAEKDQAVFLLDTATGKVRRYSTGLLKDGTYFEDWSATTHP